MDYNVLTDGLFLGTIRIPGGGGGVLLILSDEDGQMKAKTPKKSLDQKLPPNNPMPTFRALKIFKKH